MPNQPPPKKLLIDEQLLQTLHGLQGAIDGFSKILRLSITRLEARQFAREVVAELHANPQKGGAGHE